jgi:hypothetical protein
VVARRSTIRRVVLFGAALVLLVLIVCQLVLPGIATQSLRDRLAKSGQVLQVEIDAFPAIELLWNQADKVVVRMDTYTSNPGHFGSLLDQATGVDTLDASAHRLQAGPLVLHEASLRKRGDTVTGTATVLNAEVHAALPIIDSVSLVSSANGQLILQGTASALGLSATIQVVVSAQNGKLVAAPNVPFGGLATVTLFSNPHLLVEGLSAQPAPGGFTVTATGKVQ